ncbi:unnamed protein product [[Candida] boidinii]|uniref:Unnamed protein product n=1 Tax=Candida boidinii TaxID=5477 RepID=A0A9W6T8T0_CANBO|nr:unnamed protein product [[Candida] boidinii]
MLSNQTGSSPSTIIVSSSKKIDNNVTASNGQFSPTPGAKSSLKSAPCQLIKSNSSLEPAMGIFAEKKNKLFSGSLSKSMSTNSITNGGPNGINGTKRKFTSGFHSNTLNNSENNFQFVFTDVDQWKDGTSKSKKKKSKNSGKIETLTAKSKNSLNIQRDNSANANMSIINTITTTTTTTTSTAINNKKKKKINSENDNNGANDKKKAKIAKKAKSNNTLTRYASAPMVVLINHF